MPTYQVTSPLSHNGIIYQAGQQVELTTQQAESLLKLKYPPIKKDPILPEPIVQLKSESESELQSISDKTVAEARYLISQTSDLEQLENWLKEEQAKSNRRTLISLLRGRISELTEEAPF